MRLRNRERTLALTRADGLGVLSPGAETFGHRQHHSCEHRHHRGFETERRRVGHQGVAVLRPTDLAATTDLHRDEAGVAHAIEVRTHGVRVEFDHVGDLGGREWLGGPRQLEVDGVAGVVTQRLEEVESRLGVGCLRRSIPGHDPEITR